MQKTICKKLYDTQTAIFIQKYTYGYYGDPTGYEETLFQTPEGLYFLYVNGGAESIHPEENITRMSAAKADEWRKEKNV